MGGADFGLPLTSTSAGRKQRVFSTSSSTAGHFGQRLASLTPDNLRARARLTNLAVLLLVGGLAISTLTNVKLLLFDQSSTNGRPREAPWFDSHGHSGLTGRNVPQSIAATLQRDERVKAISHLVMVPGHAIWHG